MDRAGPNLALMFMAGFRCMADAATAELSRHGHPDYRVVHAFAMRAIDSGADSATELGRRLSVTKQAVAKTIATLEARGYIKRAEDLGDARRKRLTITVKGRKVLDTGAAALDSIRQRWAEQMGVSAFATFEGSLRLIVGADAGPTETANWLSRANAQ
ncbi:MAG: MarR family transcriptional regulator [Pseudoxanthomonas sp.]